jgi:hypothetical protein
MTIDLANATPDTFRPYVGQRFLVDSAAGPVALTLDNVKTFDTSMIRDSVVEVGGVTIPPRRAFALTFEGPVAPVLSSAQVVMTHPDLGDMALFVSPFRQDRDCMLYEAVFN